MAGAGDDREAGLRLDAAQQAGALVEMRVGGRVALAPDAVEPRLDLRQRLDQRPERENRRLRMRARAWLVFCRYSASSSILSGSAIISWFRL